MKGKISKIKNTKGELALPITTVEAVYLEDGTTKLSDEIKDVLKYEAFDDESITVEIPSVIEEIDGIKENISEINSSLDNIQININYNYIDGFNNLVAHRGLNGLEIENSRQAFEQTKNYGFKYVECDIQSSSDGIMYIFHDWEVDNKTNGTGVFTWKTSGEINNLYYDTGNNINKYPNTKILTLEEGIKIFSELNLIPFIELKPQANNYENMIDEVIRICKKHNLINYLIIVADDLSVDYLREINFKNPIIRLASKTIEEEIEIVKSFNCGIYGIEYTNLTEELVNRLHNEGIKIATYTVNDMKEYRKLEKLNIEFIMTDIIGGGK